MVAGLNGLIWLAMLAGGPAMAQSGGKIRSGNAVVTPSVGFYGTFRTNPYLLEAGGKSGFHLSLEPGLDLEIDAPDVKFGLGAMYTARKFVSRDNRNLDKYNDVRLDLGVELFPASVVGLHATNDFKNGGRESEADYARYAYLDRLNEDALLQLVLRPGTSMDLRAGGFLAYQDYNAPKDTSNTGSPNLNTRLEMGPRGDFKWKFFPKTAVVAQYRYSWFYWEDNYLVLDPIDAQYGEHLGIPDGRDSHLLLGLRGRFTDRVVLGLMGGYAQMTYDENSVIEDAANEGGAPPGGYDQDLKGFPAGLIGNVELGYDLAVNHSLTLGYRRDFRDIFFSNYVAYHSLYGEYRGRLADRVDLRLAGDFRAEDYVGDHERSDFFVRVSGDGVYNIGDFVDIELGGWWTRRASADGNHPAIEFDDVGVQAGLKLSY